MNWQNSDERKGRKTENGERDLFCFCLVQIINKLCAQERISLKEDVGGKKMEPTRPTEGLDELLANAAMTPSDLAAHLLSMHNETATGDHLQWLTRESMKIITKHIELCERERKVTQRENETRRTRWRKNSRSVGTGPDVQASANRQ